MKNAILLHGRPSKKEYYDPLKPSMSNAHWFPWLQAQLLKKDIPAATHEVPFSYEPIWERWVKEVERYDISSDSMLVGHSCGAGFWVRYLSEHKELFVAKLILVAPWLDVEQEDPNHFFDFEIDKDVTKRTNELIVLSSDNDGLEMQTSLNKLQKVLPELNIKVFQGYGHFTIGSMKSIEFPEILDLLIR